MVRPLPTKTTKIYGIFVVRTSSSVYRNRRKMKKKKWNRNYYWTAHCFWLKKKNLYLSIKKVMEKNTANGSEKWTNWKLHNRSSKKKVYLIVLRSDQLLVLYTFYFAVLLASVEKSKPFFFFLRRWYNQSNPPV